MSTPGVDDHVTAETLTDEQIEAERDSADSLGDTHFALLCRQALGTALSNPMLGANAVTSRRAARSLVASAMNARKAKP